jgi:hypothetical protein
MFKSPSFYLFSLVCGFCLLVSGDASAQLIGCYGNPGAGVISFSLDGKSVQNGNGGSGCGGADVHGPSISLGTTLPGGVGWRGNSCRNCSANITCYEAQDGTNQYLNKAIFSINTSGDGNAAFNWTPPSKGTWYINCDINYYNNPGGSPLSALTPHILITAD